MDLLSKLDSEIEAIRSRLAELENARNVLVALGGTEVTPATRAKRAPKAKSEFFKAKPAPKKPAKSKAPAEKTSGVKVSGVAMEQPTIKEKIIQVLFDASDPMTSADIIDKAGAGPQKASYWSALSTMTKKNEVIKRDDGYLLANRNTVTQ